MSSENVVYRPACQGRTPAECSNCPASYDCVRARSGRSFSWPFAALLIVGALALIAQMLGA